MVFTLTQFRMHILRHIHYVMDIITWQIAPRSRIICFEFIYQKKNERRFEETLWLFWEYLWFSLTKNEDETFTYRYYVIFNWSLYCPWKKRFIFSFCKNIFIRDFQIEKPYISAELIAFWRECWKWGWGVTFGTIESSKDHNDL